VACFAPAAFAGAYRLAGLVAVDRDYLGFLELPDGQQVLVRRGTVLDDGGRVERLGAEGLRIAWPDRVLELALQQSGAPRVVPAGLLGAVQSKSDQDHVLVRNVDAERLDQALATPSGARTPPGATPSAQLAQRLAPVLDLPPDARVLAINEIPVRSAEQALAIVQQSLATNGVVRLNLAPQQPGAVQRRVYVMAAPARP
jgi:hypothetical protein